MSLGISAMHPEIFCYCVDLSVQNGMAFQNQVKLFTSIFKNNFEMIFLHVIYPFLEWISTSSFYHAFPLVVKKGKKLRAKEKKAMKRRRLY